MGWSLVLTAPHRERAVASILRAYAVPYHLFCEMHQHVWRGRIIERPHPIFPGYIFAACHGAWDLVRSVGHVLGFVQLGERIATVEDRIVDQLVCASVDDILPVQIMPQVARFKLGDRVQIEGTSIWAGHVGKFQRMLLENQALVEIDCMGRWIPISVDERDLGERRRRRRRRRREESAVALSAAA